MIFAEFFFYIYLLSETIILSLDESSKAPPEIIAITDCLR